LRRKNIRCPRGHHREDAQVIRTGLVDMHVGQMPEVGVFRSDEGVTRRRA